MYVGVLLRTRRAGGRDAVAGSHLAWVDIDQDDALERIAAFDRPPSVIISTGTRGHCHCYFQLDYEIPPQTWLPRTGGSRTVSEEISRRSTPAESCARQAA